MITFLPLGGAGEIGATCYYVSIGGTGILLDCGIHPRKTGYEALPSFDLLKELPVDVALVSHAHQDHLDSLPYLVQKHPYVRIVTTPQTRAIAELTLHNSVGILREQLKAGDPLRPFEHDEVDLLIQSTQWQPYGEEFTVDGYRHGSRHSVTATFFDAGHILGSAGIFLQHGDESIFFTGDINIDNQILIRGAQLPHDGVDTLIIECTHAATDSALLPLWQDEARHLAMRGNQVLESGGSILIPVFALGKLQEMLGAIWGLMEGGELAKVDLYTGGIGRKISTVYDRNRYVVPRIDREFEIGLIPQKNLYEVDHIEKLTKEPCIMLASSGMVIEGTLSFTLARHMLGQSRGAIFIVGYMDPLTPGYRIAGSTRGSVIQLTDHSEPQQVKCSIDKFRFTAHCRREGLLEIVRRLHPKRVILVHGDADAIDWMGYAVLKNFPSTKVHVAELGKTIQL